VSAPQLNLSINKFSFIRTLLYFALIFWAFYSSPLLARPDVNNGNRASGVTCSGCHGTTDYGNFLSLNFTDGDDLIAEQVYRISLSIPGGIARSGINIEAASFNNGVGGAFVGVFTNNAGTPLSSTGTYRVGTGNAARTENGGGVTHDFYWKAPIVVPEGVKFRIQLVQGTGGGAGDRADSNEVTLGVVVAAPIDPDTDPNNPPPQDASPDTEGASSSGGAFGGGFGCARMKLLEKSPGNFPIDLGFGFLLVLGLMATYRSRKEDA